MSLQKKLRISRHEITPYLEGKSVAIVGSGPGVKYNDPKFIDSHDVVVRVNNYKLFKQTGKRTDIYYSYFGNAIKKTSSELIRDGVRLCICKCPDSQPIRSMWHIKHRKLSGIDFRWIYKKRSGWWFCPVYIPENREFLELFNLLGKHVPTTGFSAIHEVLHHKPASVYLTGFDFFTSNKHNVNERWLPGNPHDPIGHVPEKEMEWIRNNRQLFHFDKGLQKLL